MPTVVIRRFLLRVLPKGFHRIRHYRLLAPGQRAENTRSGPFPHDPDIGPSRAAITAETGAKPKSQ